MRTRVNDKSLAKRQDTKTVPLYIKQRWKQRLIAMQAINVSVTKLQTQTHSHLHTKTFWTLMQWSFANKAPNNKQWQFVWIPVVRFTWSKQTRSKNTEPNCRLANQVIVIEYIEYKQALVNNRDNGTTAPLQNYKRANWATRNSSTAE